MLYEKIDDDYLEEISTKVISKEFLLQRKNVLDIELKQINDMLLLFDK